MAQNYKFTEYLESAFAERADGLGSFYSREDLQHMLAQVKHSRPETVRFRKKQLQEMCEGVGLDMNALLKDETLLQQVKTRSQLKDALAEVIHELYRYVPGPAEYMERTVRRLAPEYGEDTVRTAILKKFLAGGGALETAPIYAWAESRLTAEERELTGQARENARIARIDDSIFTPDRLEVRVSDVHRIQVMLKRLAAMEDVDIVNAAGEPARMEPLVLRSVTARLLEKVCREAGISPEGEPAQVLQRVADNGCAGAREPLEALIPELEKDFSRLMRTTLYRNRKGNIDKAYSLYKSDKKDARKGLEKRGENWELLRLCNDFSQGWFRTNNGATRIYLYYFAIMFDMTVSFEGSDRPRPDTDMEKCLFEDYYNDNLIRFLDSRAASSSFEREPAGDGINYKNYVEAVFLYYLHHKDPALSPAQRIARAERTVELCQSAARAARQEDLIQESYNIPTQQYKKMVVEQMFALEESQIPGFVADNFYVLPNAAERQLYRIQMAGEQNTAFALACEILEELEEDMGGSAASTRLNAMEDIAQGVSVKDFWEEAREDDLQFDWKFGDFLREKYGDDARFLSLIDNMDYRLKDSFRWGGSRGSHLMVCTLRILKERTDAFTGITMKQLREALEPGCPGVSGDRITDCAQQLAELGFPVERWVERQGGESQFRLDPDAELPDSRLDSLLDMVSVAYFTNEAPAAALMTELMEEHADRRLKRTRLLSLFTARYISLLEDTGGISSFPDLAEDYISTVNGYLRDSRYQAFSRKNILDMYVLLSVYYYVVENSIG